MSLYLEPHLSAFAQVARIGLLGTALNINNLHNNLSKDLIRKVVRFYPQPYPYRLCLLTSNLFTFQIGPINQKT